MTINWKGLVDWHEIHEKQPDCDGLYLVRMPKRVLDRYSCQWWESRERSFSNDFGISHWCEIPYFNDCDADDLREIT